MLWLANGKVHQNLMTELTGSELARLVELSEARAYRSLMTSCSAEISQRYGFRAVDFGSAVAVMADSVTSSLNLNRVLGLGVDEPATESLVDELCSLYGSTGVPYAIELSPAARPEEIKRWLRTKRIRKVIDSAILYREATPPPVLRLGLQVRRTGPEHADVLAQISCQNFNMPEPVRHLLAATADKPGWRHWIAFDGGIPAAASLSFVEADVCWLGWTSTLPQYRGRWAHAAIVVAEILDAMESGCRWITTETAQSTDAAPDPAYFNLTRFGFKDAYSRPTYVAVRYKS